MGGYIKPKYPNENLNDLTIEFVPLEAGHACCSRNVGDA